MPVHPTAALMVAAALVLSCGVTACSPTGPVGPTSAASSSASQESNPAGDIPDTQTYVAVKGADGTYELQVPEGWSETRANGTISFTDKLNSVSVEEIPAAAPPTSNSATTEEVSRLMRTYRNFALTDVTEFKRNGGNGILIRFLFDANPDPVTNKSARNAAERYLFWKNGTQAALTLAGPEGADNVDPWAMVSESFRWLK